MYILFMEMTHQLSGPFSFRQVLRIFQVLPSFWAPVCSSFSLKCIFPHSQLCPLHTHSTCMFHLKSPCLVYLLLELLALISTMLHTVLQPAGSFTHWTWSVIQTFLNLHLPLSHSLQDSKSHSAFLLLSSKSQSFNFTNEDSGAGCWGENWLAQRDR